jgi:hypothetical protein
MTAVIDEKSKSYEIQFKNIDYIANLCADLQNEEKMYVEIEEKLTTERWKGVFDAACKSIPHVFWWPTRIQIGFSSDIEDLTRKTGNFKQFSIFVSMLETALSRVSPQSKQKKLYENLQWNIDNKKSSDAVSLELFTYADLEQLRNRKSLSSTNASLLKSNMQQNQQQQQTNKRYLILTYNVEFDRFAPFGLFLCSLNYRFVLLLKNSLSAPVELSWQAGSRSPTRRHTQAQKRVETPSKPSG